MVKTKLKTDTFRESCGDFLQTKKSGHFRPELFSKNVDFFKTKIFFQNTIPAFPTVDSGRQMDSDCLKKKIPKRFPALPYLLRRCVGKGSSRHRGEIRPPGPLDPQNPKLHTVEICSKTKRKNPKFHTVKFFQKITTVGIAPKPCKS